MRIGIAHERVGVPPKSYLGAYARYLRSVFERLAIEFPDPAEMRAAFQGVEKLVAFDMALAMDTYIAAQLDALARQQAAIRELSTPVIRLYHRVLLLPLIGTIDTYRADQLMEAVLLKVVDEQAHVIIIDIAGVPVVDTRVADHLLKTTEAVRLLGAQTILSGISPAIARTIVNLGMNISAMHTKSRLADALELAFEIVGAADQLGRKYIVEHAPLQPDDVIVMYSDGLATGADISGELQLLRRHPIAIAAHLLERFGRTNDDAIVLVTR